MPVLNPGAQPAPRPAAVEWVVDIRGHVIGVRNRLGLIRAVEPCDAYGTQRRAPAADLPPEPRQERPAARELLASFPAPTPKAAEAVPAPRAQLSLLGGSR